MGCWFWLRVGLGLGRGESNDVVSEKRSKLAGEQTQKQDRGVGR